MTDKKENKKEKRRKKIRKRAKIILTHLLHYIDFNGLDMLTSEECLENLVDLIDIY